MYLRTKCSTRQCARGGSHCHPCGVNSSTIEIPAELLPADGRFGCGPSKVREEQVDALVAARGTILGTSHRQQAVKDVVGRVRSGLATLFDLPAGWEILLGNGGSTMFWDAATFGLIDTRSQHLTFGEFSSKFAEAALSAPHLENPDVISAPPGDHPVARACDSIDTYALTHNETSTGVAMHLERPDGARADSLVIVDATSAAGGLSWTPSEVDVYYFAPQKSFAADGGLWLAACSPLAIERIERLASSDRWRPASLDLGIALTNSRLNQTYNTPALATLVMLENQIEWMLQNGGMPWVTQRVTTSAKTMYSWADARAFATPFVTDPSKRSSVVATIDISDDIDATTINAVLRTNGIVDTDSYRKLGRNQLRIGMFPAVDPSDIEALTACIDFVVERLHS